MARSRWASSTCTPMDRAAIVSIVPVTMRMHIRCVHAAAGASGQEYEKQHHKRRVYLKPTYASVADLDATYHAPEVGVCSNCLLYMCTGVIQTPHLSRQTRAHGVVQFSAPTVVIHPSCRCNALNSRYEEGPQEENLGRRPRACGAWGVPTRACTCHTRQTDTKDSIRYAPQRPAHHIHPHGYKLPHSTQWHRSRDLQCSPSSMS